MVLQKHWWESPKPVADPREGQGPSPLPLTPPPKDYILRPILNKDFQKIAWLHSAYYLISQLTYFC